MNRSLLHIPAFALAAVLASQPARACATCFGRSDSAMAQGMNMGILFLLVVILAVLAGLVGFIVFLARRAATAAEAAPADSTSHA